MARRAVKLPNCGACWDHKHGCPRDPVSLVCRECRSHVIQGRNGSQSAPQFRIPFEELIRANFHQLLAQEPLSWLALDIPRQECHRTLSLQVLSSTGRSSTTPVIDINGTFDARSFDKVVQDACTISLEGKEETSKTISHAILAGGYIHLLSSAISAEVLERFVTTVGGMVYANEPRRYYLETYIRYLAFCRLCELLYGCLNAIRFEDPSGQYQRDTLEAYAAAVILRYEVAYFKRSLRYGALSRLKDHLPFLKSLLISWFEKIEAELTHYLRVGCGKYPRWQDTIKGSKKVARRQHETFSLSISLDINQFTVCGKPPPPATNFTNPAAGDIFLSSPQNSPLLQALALSYDVPDGIEQLPSHVMDLTSVVVASDLSPDLQFLLRASDEDEDYILTD
ncbi:hypothetical protein BKA64DRAFT_681942 [Cadophora sp. MPI-SDFR-AT-0126]|nr:hypothetical protein BKA64DRAFT_681942 [Leotiomycetes sp. MPI-SDFR-AT-0126]